MKKIREYNDKADRAAVLNLLRANTPEYFSPDEEADLIWYFENDADNYFVVTDGDDFILAAGGFNLSEDGETGKLSWDIVDPRCQGMGVGSYLTRYRIAAMKKIAGVKTISVRTSQLVYPFYERFGLQLREVVKDYWAEGIDLYRLDCPADEVLID